MTFRNISTFKTQLTGGGTRSNLFEVELNFPAGVTAPAAELTQFLVKAAALPASNITPIEVPFRGRVLKVAGERTFDSWTITVLNDTNFAIRTAFEQWMNAINNLTEAKGEVNPATYAGVDARVFQLAKNGDVIRQYDFIGVWPTNVSQIDLSMDSTDSIQEFTVELQVLYWTIADSPRGGTGASTGTAAGAPAIK